MNLECQVCTGNKIATCFLSLDDLQAHLIKNHHDGSLEVFQFVCHNCESKLATDYRLLRHEQTCGRESRSEENMEKIRYKLQMYELLETTLKYNITKHQTSSVPPANPSNIETSETRESSQTQCQTESYGAKSIKSELFESRENFVPNLRQENIKRNGSGEAAGTSPSLIMNEPTKNFGNLRTVKAETEPENVDAPEMEVLGTVEIRKRKAPSKSAEHITYRSGGNAQQNVNSAEESYNLRQTKQAKTNLEPAQIPLFNSARDQEERMATFTSTAANLTKIIHVKGPCLHPEEMYPEIWQKQELRTYFSQFGKINSITVSNKCRKSTVTFDNSVAKCIEQQTHKIRGQNFGVRVETPTQSMIAKIIANQRISVTGPLLHPEVIDPKAFQKEMFRKYFGQFGKVIFVWYSMPKLEAEIAFDNCESAAICIQQGNHTICGRDFVIPNLRQNMPGPLSENKLKQKKKLGPTLSQNMPGPSTGNVSAANVPSDQQTESNFGNQSPQSTESSSSEGSVIYCETISKEWPQSYGLASFDKPG
ncbi:hypothetical protein Ddc_15781 [Ditylenchus destructor]|nr:hypothetical protein Ddc_15781 [Ditylenchus destructor]